MNFLKRIWEARPKSKDPLDPPTLEESKKQCKEINATPTEIKRARKQECHYICTRCGYHSAIIRRCPVCGGWLRYWTIAEIILDWRELDKEWKEKAGKE